MTTLHADIVRAENVPITDEDCMKICDSKTRIVLYHELENMTPSDFMDLFQKETNYNIILLYELQGEIGHWITIIYHPLQDAFSHFDSYGLLPDEEINLFKHKEPHLTRLYNGLSIKVHPNKERHQRFKNHINTCGRWASIRAVHYDKTNDQFNRYIKSSNPGQLIRNTDELVACMTMIPLRYTLK